MGRERKGRGFLATNRRLVITRQGKVFLGITLALGFGVLNSGNNLLFLCLGLLLSIITVSGILSEWNVRDLRFDLRTETLAIAGRDHVIELTVENTNERRESFSIVLDVTFIGKSPWNKDDDPVRLKKSVTLVHVPKNGEKSARGEVRFEERGDYEVDEVSMETEYPFGLFKKQRVFLPIVKLTVAPSPSPLDKDMQLPPQRPARTRGKNRVTPSKLTTCAKPRQMKTFATLRGARALGGKSSSPFAAPPMRAMPPSWPCAVKRAKKPSNARSNAPRRACSSA